MPRKYAHLAAGARALIDGTDEERIRYSQQDRFVPYSAVLSILELLDGFVNRPVSIRPPCLALVGDSGCGKSTLMEELERRYRNAADPTTRKVVVCTMDPLPELRVSQRALLTALGVPATMSLYRPRVDGDDLIARSLRELGTRLVVFDETLHMTNLHGRALNLQWDWIKWVSTANRVSVVCTGIPGFEQTIREESQLESRFTILRIPRWSAGPSFEQFLSSFEQSLPLRRPSGLGTARMQEAILRESGLQEHIAGITQGIKQVIERAAIEAIRTGIERVTLPLLSAWRESFEPPEWSRPRDRSIGARGMR
ncbi:MAG TPA: TniB family NTP-binding protein [Steroidobacteraceae bacterium]|nr:TniB family NTP-binding protein [Steroidobacteraceae bacterium]